MPGPDPPDTHISVLYVDDDLEYAQMAKGFLTTEDDGLSIRLATRVDEAVTCFGDIHIDCVLTDYEMPDRTGFDLLHEVRARDPMLPVILYTGRGSEAVASEAIERGVTGYLQKTTNTSHYTLLANRIRTLVDRYRATKRARTAHQRLEHVVEHSPLGIIEWTDGGSTNALQVARVNDTATTLLDSDDADLRGASWDDLTTSPNNTHPAATALPGDPPDAPTSDTPQSDAPTSNTPQSDTSPSNRIIREHTEVIGTDGDPIICAFHHRVTPDAHDDTSTIVSMFHDVTDSVTKLQRLEETSTLFTTLFETLPVGVLAEDSDRNVLAVNNQLLELFTAPGTPESMVGADCEHLAEQVAPQFTDPAGFIAGITECVTNRTPVDRTELDLRDGRTVERSYRPTELPGGDGHLWIYRDVTTEQTRAAQLQQERDQLDAFASIVGHDLRNPLAVAKGNAELLGDTCDDPALEAIDRALDRMDALIENLLLLAREGSLTGVHEPVTLADVSAACWDTIVTAEATLRLDTDRTIWADPMRAKQLLENLFSNAIRHGGDAVTVTVGDLSDGFYVEDDGVGIPADAREQVFDAGHSTATGGTGFGLSIVAQVADAHGWHVHLTESDHGGARFEFTGVT